MHSPLLLRSEDTLVAILNACLRTDAASESAYLVVYHFVMLGQEHLKDRL